MTALWTCYFCLLVKPALLINSYRLEVWRDYAFICRNLRHHCLHALVVVVWARNLAEAVLPMLIDKLQQGIPGCGIGIIQGKGLLPMIEDDENRCLHARVQSAAPIRRIGMPCLLSLARSHPQ